MEAFEIMGYWSSEVGNYVGGGGAGQDVSGFLYPKSHWKSRGWEISTAERS